METNMSAETLRDRIRRHDFEMVNDRYMLLDVVFVSWEAGLAETAAKCLRTRDNPSEPNSELRRLITLGDFDHICVARRPAPLRDYYLALDVVPKDIPCNVIEVEQMCFVQFLDPEALPELKTRQEQVLQERAERLQLKTTCSPGDHIWVASLRGRIDEYQFGRVSECYTGFQSVLFVADDADLAETVAMHFKQSREGTTEFRSELREALAIADVDHTRSANRAPSLRDAFVGVDLVPRDALCNCIEYDGVCFVQFRDPDLLLQLKQQQEELALDLAPRLDLEF